MTKSQTGETKGRQRYYLMGMGIALTVIIVASLIIFWDKLQEAAGYSYAGCFLVTVMAGMTVIPAPAMPLVFTLGHKLSPLYVGLVAGFGEALGGTTIYLTGAGGGTIWAKVRSRVQAASMTADSENGDAPLFSHGVQSRQRAFFDRVMAPMRHWSGFWPVFIASALIFSPFYFVGLGAGALGMGLKRFFLISWAGKTVKGLYVAFAGYWGLRFLLSWLGG